MPKVSKSSPKEAAVFPTAIVFSNERIAYWRKEQQNRAEARRFRNKFLFAKHVRMCTKQKCTYFCDTAKALFSHFNSCTEGDDCVYPFCTPWKKVLVHWKTCTLTNCTKCPFKR